MSFLRRRGISVVGVIFLALGILKFVQGEAWVVWIVLAVLFGVLSQSKALQGGDSKHD